MKMKFLFLACHCFVFCSPCLGQETPRHGRLPDGRAFRIDARGAQVTDYVAELELSVEALNRRVKELEIQLTERRAAREDPLVERDLLPASPDHCAPCGAPETRAALEEARREIEMFKADLLAERRRGDRDVRDRIDRESRCVSALDELVLKLQFKTGEAAAYEHESNTLRSALRRKDAPPQEGAAAVAVVSEAARRAAAIAPRAAFPAVSPAVSAVEQRSELQSEMNRLQRLVDQRSVKLKQYESGPQAVKFKITAADNKAVAAVREEMMAGADPRRLNRVRAQIRQMERQVQEDIALLDRLMRAKTP